MSEIYEIADAVAAALNDADFNGAPLSFEAVRVYLPLQREELLIADPGSGGPEPTVLVAPHGDDIEPLHRDDRAEDIEIGVGVYQKLTATTDPTALAGNTILDPLLQFCRNLALVFGPNTDQGDVQTAGDGVWIKTKYSPLYDWAALKDKRIFLAVIKFTFRQQTT